MRLLLRLGTNGANYISSERKQIIKEEQIMNKKLVIIIAVIAGIVAQTQALVIELKPDSSGLVAFGNENNGGVWNTSSVYTDLILYKSERNESNVAGMDSGVFASSYNTSYFNTDLVDSDARISYVGGTSINSSKVFAYIKDGNSTPNWYVFDITGWNGVQTIEFSGFFVGVKNTKNVSHVTIYGESVTTPDGGLTVGLLGMALAAMGIVKRKLK